jgi:hypothetical protein
MMFFDSPFDGLNKTPSNLQLMIKKVGVTPSEEKINSNIELDKSEMELINV